MVKYILILSLLTGLALQNQIMTFAGAQTKSIDTIATVYTDAMQVTSDDVFLTTQISGGVAGYTNYVVQANVNGIWQDVISDSLGAGVSGAFETILLRNRDSIGNFPYSVIRVKHVTSDPTGTFTLSNVITK